MASSGRRCLIDDTVDWLSSGDEDFSSDESEDEECAAEDEFEDVDDMNMSFSSVNSSSASNATSTTSATTTSGANPEFVRDRKLQPQDFPFDDTVTGIRVRLDPPERLSFFDYLRLFFTSAIIDLIVVETNRFGQHKHGADWEAMTDSDIWRLFGLVLLMGIVKKPSLKDYWSTSDILATPIFNNMISRDRFRIQLGALHFVDNSLERNNDILFKLGDILQRISNRLSAVFHPSKFISVDESLVAWRGRFKGRQYIPSKRSRFGIKLFLLCDSVTGYIYKLSVYVGDEKAKAAAAGRSVTQNIVMNLMDGLLNLGHYLFMDNYYNSVDLTKDLLSNKTHVCGTIRSNRKGLPKSLKLKANGRPMDVGEVTSFSNGSCMVGCWRDKNYICMISTLHDSNNLVDSGKTKRNGDVILKPKPVLLYNKYMGGVDKSDQLLHYYNAARKSMKWYKKLFFHLLDVSTVNSV